MAHIMRVGFVKVGVDREEKNEESCSCGLLLEIYYSTVMGDMIASILKMETAGLVVSQEVG